MPGSLPQMLVAILCGGRGTRLQEHSPEVPKPLVEIGGRPILWHVIQIYAAQGYRRFLLLCGYRGEQIEAFARETYWPEGVEVRCVDTGAGHADRRAAVAGARRALGRRRSWPPTPTASPTSTSPRCAPATRRPARWPR